MASEKDDSSLASTFPSVVLWVSLSLARQAGFGSVFFFHPRSPVWVAEGKEGKPYINAPEGRAQNGSAAFERRSLAEF